MSRHRSDHRPTRKGQSVACADAGQPLDLTPVVLQSGAHGEPAALPPDETPSEEIRGIDTAHVTFGVSALEEFKTRLMEVILQDMRDRVPPVLIISGILVECGVDLRYLERAFSAKPE